VLLPSLPRTRPLAETEERFELEKEEDATQFRSGSTIEIERSSRSLCCLCLFFSSFEHVKSLLIMGPNSTKNSSKSVIFSYLTINNIVRILFLLSKKKSPNLIKKLFLCFVSKTKSGAHKQLTY
jgi:hypothetical protein